MNRNNLAVVLVEPRGARNIGSTCRAMLNFGFTDLRLVNPQVDHLCRDAQMMAVKATGVLENAKIFSSLAGALNDCVASFGTTRRFGRYRENMLHPEDASEIIVPATEEGTVALVFGREDNGLLTNELDLCHHFITIPTSDQQPSMNLAQAVGLCLYEVIRVNGVMQKQTYGRKSLATNEQIEGMFQHMRQTLINIGYLNPQNPDHILRSYRRMLGRAGLNEKEVKILRGLFNQIDVFSGAKLARK